ncbi:MULTISPECIES: ATP-binding protein [unclassified Diaminobutyricimonas]|uniref:sensor histidine kinase n=1 Tax=unclassified Diaminobutyricimonas TaxID=2643261 RepID=UPI0012F50F98|nr:MULTISPECIES: ATP-binding protein [unclassified Diaminobutyricimonas]
MTSPWLARSVRVIAICIAVGAAVFTALAIGLISDQAPTLAGWYFVLSLVALPGVALLLGAIAHRLDIHRVRRLAGWLAIGYLGLILLWMPAASAPTPVTASPWILSMTAVPTSAAALAWRPGPSWTYVGLVGLGTGWLSHTASGGEDPLRSFQDGLFVVMFCAIFSAIVSEVQRASIRLDAAAVAARRETALAAAADARERQRVRVDGLLHDSVFSTLLFAGRSGAGPLPANLAAHATTALKRIDAMKGPDTEANPMSADDFVATARTITAQLMPTAVVKLERDGEPQIPADAQLALSEALAEALRNSLRHASAANVEVRIHVTDTGAEIAVLDDGLGFDPSNVDPARLGISVSILGRMRGVQGGSAAVSSTPGRGCQVVLSWEALGG